MLGFQPKLELNGFAVFLSGERKKFSLMASEPFPHPEFKRQCDIVCEVFRKEPMRVHGPEADFAWCQVLGFIYRMVGYMELTLEDEDGRPLKIPKPYYEKWGVEFP